MLTQINVGERPVRRRNRPPSLHPRGWRYVKAQLWRLGVPLFRRAHLLTWSSLTGGLLAALYLVNVWPRNTYTPLLLGAVLQSVSMGMLAWALYVERSPVIMGMMALVGVGSGFRLLCRKCTNPEHMAFRLTDPSATK